MKKLEIEGLNNETPKEVNKNVQEENLVFSSKLVDYFSSLAKEFRKDHKASLTANNLKKVYCHGARLGKSQGVAGLHLYALARVHMFLRLKSGGKMTTEEALLETVKATKLELEEDKKAQRASGFIDISEGWIPSLDDFEKSQKEIEKNDLECKYEDIEDLYLEYKPIQLEW